jgi:hypothetical protein
VAEHSIVGSITTIAIGAAIGFGASEYVESNRYSIHEEFILVESCVESSMYSLHLEQYRKKVEICACALENTQKEYDYKDVLDEKKQKSFLKKFREEVNECSTH